MGGTWDSLTVLFLPDREGVVPFRLGKLANISNNWIGRGSRRIARFASSRTVEGVEKARYKERDTQESEMRLVKHLVHLWGGMKVKRDPTNGHQQDKLKRSERWSFFRGSGLSLIQSWRQPNPVEVSIS